MVTFRPRPADVDLALVYDGFTFNAISWLEALGFCGFGEAYDWLDGGRRIAPDGELPVNPHGGQLSEGRLHGFGFLYEAVQQLRHDAGARQVPNAATAVVTSGGGTPSGVFLLLSATGREAGAEIPLISGNLCLQMDPSCSHGIVDTRTGGVSRLRTTEE